MNNSPTHLFVGSQKKDIKYTYKTKGTWEHRKRGLIETQTEKKGQFKITFYTEYNRQYKSIEKVIKKH